MNRDMFRRVADVIELEDRFDLSLFASGDLLNECGTTGCIAGWTAALAGAGDDVDIERAAREALGLTWRQADRLFFWGNSVWVDHADALGLEVDAFQSIDPGAVTSVQAAKMLRWIADGEVEL